MSYDAIVIGAGPNGLTAAAVLARKGRKILVLERADEIGGHTRPIEFAPGFRSPLDGDGGWVPTSVENALGFRAQYGPRTVAQAYAPSGSDGQRWTTFTEMMQRFAGVLGALYQLTPPDIDTSAPAEILPLLRVALKTRALGRREMVEFLRVMPMSVQDLVDDTFQSEELKAGVASAALRDLAQGPRAAGTTFNLLHWMIDASPGTVRRLHWHFNRPNSFSHATANAARSWGVEIRTGAHVEHIRVSDGAVTGVILGGEGLATAMEIAAPIVISTADPKRTLLELVDPVWLDPEFMLAVHNIRMRGCAAFVLYGLGANPGEQFTTVTSLTTSTVALEKAADAFKYGEISAEPHVEIFSPTARWPQAELAPAGKHVLAARVQFAPYHLEGGWTPARADEIEKKATAAISRAIPGFANTIEQRAVLTPRDVEEQFGVTEGALTQGQLMLDQILFMRPVPGWGHYEMPVRGLFLGGAGAHPGPGVLGGAGYLAARAALRHR